ncbi:MAG: hypothetical protein D6694_00460 [Gammaproteobacteria bacterium]|nr:MAG: hypothetical protein D6694_00460 [Gammaproteobacteria bacterium]
MLDIADKKDVATKPYTLFCDKPSESLKPNQHGQFEPFRQIGLEGKYQAFFDESLDLTDEFCVLRVDDRVFVGTSLGQHIDQQRRTTTGALPSFIEAIRNDPEYCANVDKTSPTWQGCKNNDVWYNPATKMVIYGFSDGSNVDEFDLLQLADLEEETVFSTVFDTLDLVFSRILSFIGIGIYEDTLETKQFVEEARNFDKLYIAQGDNGRFVRAVKESITRELEDGSRSGNAVSFMTAEYHNIISPVCRTYLDPDFDYQFRMVGSTKTSGVVDGSSKTIPHQPRFTCELDIRSANDWTYIVHVEDLSRGLQFKNAGTEELPFEFADLWRDLTSVMRLDEGFSKDDVYKEEATSTSAGSITITKATSQGLCTSTTLSSVVAGQPFCINVSGLSAQDQEHILGITYSIGERNASVLGAGPVIMSFVEGTEESLPLQAKILYDNFAVRTASTTLQRYAGPFFNPHVDSGNISVDIADDRGYATWNINWDFYDINTLITSENCVGVSAGDDRCSVEVPSSGRKVKLTATDTYGIIVERTFNYR